MSEIVLDRNLISIPIEVTSVKGEPHTMKIVSTGDSDNLNWGYEKDGSSIFTPFSVQTPEQEYYNRPVEAKYYYGSFASIPASKSESCKVLVTFNSGRYLITQVSTASDYIMGSDSNLATTLNNTLVVPSGVTYTQKCNQNNNYKIRTGFGWSIKNYNNISCVTTYEANITDRKELAFYTYSPSRAPVYGGSIVIYYVLLGAPV